MARPRAGDWLEDEVDHWKRSGVDVVVSLLEAQEVEELALREEAMLCRERGIAFRSFPIADRGVPEDIEAALRFAREMASTGQSIAVHCRAGIGRSSLMAAAILISAGEEAGAVLSAIAQARGLPVPDTETQRAWVLNLR